MRPAFVRNALLASSALAMALIALPAPGATADPVTPVEVITDDPYANATPPDYKMSYALKEAEARALAKPDVYGQPYVYSGTLIATVTSADAQSEAGQAVSLPPDLAPPDDGSADPSSVPPPQDKDTVTPAASAAATSTGSAPSNDSVAAKEKAARTSSSTSPSGASASATNPWIVYPKVHVVPYSWNRLNAIKDEVVTLTPDVMPDSDKILNALVQPERDRVLVEATSASDALRTGLATRYGSDAVAIRLVEDPGPSQTEARQNDSSVGGFYGGARIYTSVGSCTNGFPWRYSGYQAMITAGHCTTMGGSVATPVEYVGSVVKDTWANNKGTVLIDGQSSYHGDASLIKLGSGKTSTARIYVGSSTSASSRAVGAMWSRRADYGDQYCTGGSTAGELCGWKVSAIRINHKYSDGTVLKNGVRGYKHGQCTLGGDSGGPVYTVTSAGKVVAKGIHNGAAGGGSDHWGGAFDPCIEYFTDIWDAYLGFPGTLATS
ncbi:S1 family peptidase [Planotetraspora sp. A-T 1434]|uniref:S1 family peptidase n=1 Tax=Planotetraspora sp. A-T 1434 TaxID=2979219 RepID=UPI0021BE7365|nr:S1 family peptidase [Planotetraspora sp. A-T 1434]MCT9934034.1 S1 family peptidase [Planotetraspora sp. A-T 1434]